MPDRKGRASRGPREGRAAGVGPDEQYAPVPAARAASSSLRFYAIPADSWSAPRSDSIASRIALQAARLDGRQQPVARAAGAVVIGSLQRGVGLSPRQSWGFSRL
jgi:hypothetical protein